MSTYRNPLIEVIVGNIGCVYRGFDEDKAAQVYAEYVEQSKSGYGRAAGETVTLLIEDDIIKEHFGEAE